MSYRFVVATGILLVVMHTQAFTSGVTQALPLRNGRPVVATVNRDAISLDEFVLQLGTSADRARLRQGRGTASDMELLERLITIKLVVQEAATMGLDDLPEIRKQVEVSSREILREVLLARLVKGVTPDAAAVEKQFRELVREWKTAELLFQNDAAAQRARKEIAGGAAFSQVAAAAVAAKTAGTDADSAYHPKRDYLPQIAAALATLRVGQVSPVIRLQSGFVIVKVVDIRYPEDREARAEARKTVANQKQQEVLKAHGQTLMKQYTVVNKGLLKSIDYTAAKPGIDALLKDKRVVAEIKGAAPVTVGDLTDYLRLQFFHGDDKVRQGREMNAKKDTALDAMLGRRLLNLEAQRLGIDKANEYRDRVTGYRDSLIFETFMQKVIAPENKMKEDEVKQYYGGHLKEYSSPEMLKVRSLAFTRRAAAENAVRKLREGTDYNWLAANAEGQVDKGAQELLAFDERPVMLDSMPEDVRKALAGVKSGETRIYASPQGHFYLLAIQQVIPPIARPYDEVREEVAKKLYAEKLKKGVEEYARKLRAQSKVATYLKKV